MYLLVLLSPGEPGAMVLSWHLHSGIPSILVVYQELKYSCPPCPEGGMFQHPQEMSEPTESTPYIFYIYCAFSYTYIPMIKFNS